MSTPLVSIIMPVYNTAPYLAESVSSILDQEFTDFEFIIIDDGSTDGSDNLLRNFQDPRILFFSNEGNKGLVYTLNRGLELARGIYIARMDGDDVSLPGRIAKQVEYLQKHHEVDLLASRVELINEKGASIGEWKDEARHVSQKSIRSFLPINNCIAHPSIMAKADKLKKYGYDKRQAQAEDYDLWLRMCADGLLIHKLDEVLVKHRILESSFTRKRQENVFKKLSETKWRFAWNAISEGRVNAFVLKTLFFACIDALKAILKPSKNSS